MVHISKGENVHQEAVQARIAAARPTHLVLTDMGSRAGPLLPGVPTLVVDHHQPQGFPDGAVVRGQGGAGGGGWKGGRWHRGHAFAGVGRPPARGCPYRFL